MRILNASTKDNQRGAVLIIALLFTTMLASLALSSASNMESTVAVARDQADAIRAELAADAGLQYARNHLGQDLEWAGTDGAWISLPDSTFQVEVTITEDNLPASATVRIRSEGRSGNAVRAVEHSVNIVKGDDFGEFVLIMLGSEFELEQAKIHGNVFIPDAVGAVMDYSVDGLGNQLWTLNQDPLGEFEIEDSQCNKEIHQFTNTKYFKGKNDIHQREDPIFMPGWDLDSYLDPAAGNWIITSGGEYEGITTNQTVVLNLPDGAHVKFKDCQLHNGIVVWAPKDYDIRGPALNSLEVESSNIGTGAAPHISIIAPATEVEVEGNGMNLHGFNYWHSGEFEGAHLTGILVIAGGEETEIEEGILNSHPPTMKDLPDGIIWKGGSAEFDVLGGGEDLN